MRVLDTDLAEVKLIEPSVFGDARGLLMELWSPSAHPLSRCVLDLVTTATRGVIRGLHFQAPFAQAKLVSALDGEIFDVAVDVRRDSPTFGRWTSAVLSSENHRQLFMPEGFAHGFAVLSERALVHYKLAAGYHPEAEAGIAWNDPDLGIAWPITAPLISARDASLPRLRERFP